MGFNQIVTDQDIQALVDNEFPWETEKRLLQLIKGDIRLKQRYEELVRQKKLLRLWHQHQNA